MSPSAGAKVGWRTTRGWLMFLAGLALFALLLSQVSVAELVEVLSQAQPAYIVAAVMFGLAATVVRVVRFYHFFPAPGRWLELYAAFASVRAINYVLPFRSGELAALALLKKRGLAPSIAETSPVWLMLRAADVAALLVLLAGAVLVAGPVVIDDWRMAAAVLAAAAASVGGLAALPILARGLARRPSATKKAGWIGARLADLRKGLARIDAPGAIGWTLVAAIAIWALNIASQVATLLAFAAPLRIAEGVLATVLVLGVNLLPIRTPLGLGTGDVAWTGVFVLLGMDIDAAVALALGMRLVQMLLIGLDGAIGLLLPLLRTRSTM